MTGPKNKLLVFAVALAALVFAAHRTAGDVRCPPGINTAFPNGDFNEAVRNLCFYRGELFASGNFTRGGGTGVRTIARFAGGQWFGVGPTNGPAISVGEMVVYNDTLVGVGDFSLAGVRQGVAAWNGTSWNRIGNLASSSYGRQLATDGERLCVTDGTDVFVWNGAAWATTPRPTTSVVDLAIYQNCVYAAGPSSPAWARNAKIFRLVNDQWIDTAGPSDTALKMFVHGDRLVVATSYSSSNSSIFTYDAHTWSAPVPVRGGNVWGLGSLGSALLVGGSFTSVNGIPARGLARLTESGWSELGGGLDYAAEAFAETNGDLFVGGRLWAAGNTRVNHIARWDGSSWHSLQPAGNGTTDSVRDCGIAQGQRVLIGRFHGAGPVITAERGAEYGAAIFDGTSWSPFPLPVNSGISSIQTVDDVVYAVGNLQGSGIFGVAPAVVRLGPSGWIDLPGAWGRVSDVLGYKHTLVAYGSGIYLQDFSAYFTIASWNGYKWAPFGSPDPESVVSMFEFKGVLYLLAEFKSAVAGEKIYSMCRLVDGQWDILPLEPPLVDSRPVFTPDAVYFTSNTSVVRWDGSAWTQLPGTMGVNAIVMHQGRLFATGRFTTFSDSSVIGMWNGAAWVRVYSSATNGGIAVLESVQTPQGPAIIAAGGFSTSGGRRTSNVAVHTLDICICLGDVNADGVISSMEVSVVLGSFGRVYDSPYAGADFTGDARVDSNDLNYVLAHFGQVCAY